MPARQDQYTMSLPVSPPPPTDISTYARSMHQHTKKQMDEFNRSSHRGSSSSGKSSSSSSLSNGMSPPYRN